MVTEFTNLSEAANHVPRLPLLSLNYSVSQKDTYLVQHSGNFHFSHIAVCFSNIEVIAQYSPSTAVRNTPWANLIQKQARHATVACIEGSWTHLRADISLLSNTETCTMIWDTSARSSQKKHRGDWVQWNWKDLIQESQRIACKTVRAKLTRQ